MRDFLAEAKHVLTKETERLFLPRDKAGEKDTFALEINITRGLLIGLINEIETLRADVVITRTMAGFREIKQGIKNGPSL